MIVIFDDSNFSLTTYRCFGGETTNTGQDDGDDPPDYQLTLVEIQQALHFEMKIDKIDKARSRRKLRKKEIKDDLQERRQK